MHSNFLGVPVYVRREHTMEQRIKTTQGGAYPLWKGGAIGLGKGPQVHAMELVIFQFL